MSELESIIPDYPLFSSGSHKVFASTYMEAIGLYHSAIGTQDLLLAFLNQDTPLGIRELLNRSGLIYPEVRKTILNYLGSGLGGPMTLTPAFRMVLAESRERSEESGLQLTPPFHIAHSLVDHPLGIPDYIVDRNKINLEELRKSFARFANPS